MSSERKLVSSGSPYEPIIGFSRAVRVGGIIAVGGTAPIGVDGKTVGVGDPALQTKRCFEIIEQALKEAGAGLKHVVRTRTFLTDVSQWEAIGRVHGEIFGSIRPASTMVQVTGFLDPEWLVEIEADAVIGDGGDNWQNAWAASDDTGTPQS
jgi:enamine deaminase RidA (YjgF/YER057c/UK114 family)